MDIANDQECVLQMAPTDDSRRDGCSVPMAIGEKAGRFFWMEKAAKEAISRMIYFPENADWGCLRNFEEDQYGRVYAEMECRSVNEWGFKVPRTYAMIFIGVTDDAPCEIGEPGPRMIRYLPGFRHLVRGTLRFGKEPKANKRLSLPL